MQDKPPSQKELKEDFLIIMPSLPGEIIVDILSMLPVKSILRFRCVCKYWCNKLLKDPKFFKLHLDHASGNHKFFLLLENCNQPMRSVNLCPSSAHNNESVEIDNYPLALEEFYYRSYGSCNGLILMPNPWECEGVVLWNPSTKEIMEIPEPVDDQISTYGDFYIGFDAFDEDIPVKYIYKRYGFGYSPIIDDYKIVRTKEVPAKAYGNALEINVYTLGSKSWKRIPNPIPYKLYLGGDEKPVSLNGALHWIGSLVDYYYGVVIVSFDIGNDTFDEVPVNRELRKSLGFGFLGTFHGCLSVVQGDNLDSESNKNVDISIWVMKEYGVGESWTKMFTVSNHSMERSIKYSTMTVLNFRNGMILFLKDKSSWVLYDPKHQTARVVDTCGLSSEEGWSYVDTYVESLVSLNSGIYLGRNRVNMSTKR